MGYEGVEFAGIFDKSYTEVKELCQKYDLVPVSAHVSLNDLRSKIDEIIDGYKHIGCKQIAIPWIPKGSQPGDDGFKDLMEEFIEFGKKCKEKGMLLAYHNHDFEFVNVNGEYGLDVLYSSVPSDLLKCQIDTCWVGVAGVNPSEYVRKYAGRMYTVHLKDYVGSKTDNMYGLIGLKEDDGKSAPTVAFDFRAIGYGVQDIPAILEASADAGAEWAIVEIDRPALGSTPMECVEMSVKYLMSL